MKRLIKIIVVFGLLLTLKANTAVAQYCGTQEYIDHLEHQHPGIKAHMDKMYMEAVKSSQVNSLYKILPRDTILTIQVVFHVVYKTEAQNIPDSLIQDQLRTLNEAFNRENADTINTRDIFKQVAGSARIRFVFASTDPDGNPTDGITRSLTTLNTFNASGSATTNDYVKQSSFGGKPAWNTNQYLNIWVCNLNLTNGNRALFGYAYPPVGAAFWNSTYFKGDPFQGVVLHYEIVGKDNPSNLSATLYTNEKTAVHEVGHYLGLRHVWGDAPWGQNGCAVDDFIEDTPNSVRASSGCNYGVNTCNTDNLPDQLENYMDYSSAACTNMFTAQQIAVMRRNLIKLRPGVSEAQFVGESRPDIAKTSLFPNPFSSEIRLYVEDPQEEMIVITMYDLLGRVVLHTTVVANTYVQSVPTEAIMIGMYYVTVVSEKTGQLLETKVIKSH